jgi:hypothetical protein
MNSKPVTPAMHGIIDYVFSGIQLAAPPLFGLSKQQPEPTSPWVPGFYW